MRARAYGVFFCKVFSGKFSLYPLGAALPYLKGATVGRKNVVVGSWVLRFWFLDSWLVGFTMRVLEHILGVKKFRGIF